MNKEFNLSEKEEDMTMENEGLRKFCWKDDIKEFIRLRNKLDSDLRNNRITWSKYLDKRRKLAEEKLCQQ